jgi:hypothetical protein
MTKPRFRPVITPGGFAVLVIALVMLVRSLLSRKPYEILIGMAALLLLLVLVIIGSWKAKKLESLEPGWKPFCPATANAGEEMLVTGMGSQIPLFFRLHFIVRGRFSPCGCGRGHYMLAETSVPRGENSARLKFDFPMSGVFQGEGSCRLRDIFGFFSFPCGIVQRRTVYVRSAPCFKKNYYINAQSGAEDRRNKNTSNEERYYMREYTPGDRLRDINWKSSERIDTLITRISPDNQEKVSRIEVYFRNYGAAHDPSIQALWLLDRAKAQLARFLRSAKEEQSSYIFNIRTSHGNWEIEDQDDLEEFLDALAGIPFSQPVHELVGAAGTVGELYVFSTACDSALPSFLLACHPRPVSLFLVQPVIPGQNRNAETLYIRNFPAMGCMPSPRWLLPNSVKYLKVASGRVEINYAETKL